MQDSRDASTLFDIIEHEIIPLFYQRDERGIPRGWVERIRASLRTNGPRYSAARMVGDYSRDIYGLTPTR
jgi:starch phosphorylase